MPGFVYILSNPAFPHLVKIGKSEKDPSRFRAAELYTTGVPQKFIVEYYALVENHHYAEAECHKILDCHRPNKNREFFEYPIPDAIALIRRMTPNRTFEKVFFRTDAEIRLAAERQQAEAETSKKNKEIEFAERERNENIRLQRRAAIDSERQKYIFSELESTEFIPRILMIVFGYFSFLLAAIAFGDLVFWPILVLIVMWTLFWAVEKSRANAAEHRAREKFPYT